MSGECVFDLVDTAAPTEYNGAVADGSFKKRTGTYGKSKKAPPPTASTFGIHGTSAVVANAGGENTDPSIHPAKKPIGTFGREVSSTIDPTNFLRKNQGPYTASRGAPTVDDTKFKKSAYDREKRKADIPSRYDKPVMGLRTDKDYVVANAVENIMAIPSKSTPAVQPRATDRSDFGKVPEYLEEIKTELHGRRAMIEMQGTVMKEANERWSELSSGELTELRNGLQHRWETLNRDYQSKGFSKLETPSQKAHREVVEKELCAVEFAMQKLSRSHVFIYDDRK